MLDIDVAVQQIAAIVEATGGATFSMYWDNLAGKRLYAVVPFGDLKLRPRPGFPQGLLRTFVRRHWELLRDPRICIGVWFNRSDGLTYVELSAVFPNRDEARAVGIRYNEQKGFDLHLMEEFDIGGTGVPPPDRPPVTERLPQLRSPGRRRKRLPSEGPA